MPTLWRVRSFVCLLLAVSTAVGGIAPVRACACATPTRAPTPAERVKLAPAAKSCCQSAKKRSCCTPAPTGHAPKKGACCGDKAPPAPAPADSPGCHCLRCDCDPTGVPPAPVPAPPATDLDEHAAVSLAPPAFVPTTPSPAVRAAPAAVIPPTDLTISLSRLTC